MKEEKKFINLFKSNSRLSQGNLQIIACAGSGKTEFVSTRIAYLVSEKITKPENIVAFTFTEKAAEELKLRIRLKILEIVGKSSDIGDIYVGTIHGFCFNLLKEYIPGFRGYDVIDEGKRYAFVSSIRNDLKLYMLENWLNAEGKKKFWKQTSQSWVINSFINGVDVVREEMIDVEKITDSKHFIEAFKTYEKRLHEKHFLDFSNIMFLTLKALKENKEILDIVRRKYTHITVDEYQDINPIQEEIIKLLTGDNNNICVVGDDDQSIFHWRGANINNILTFKKRYKDVYAYELPVNYRSIDKIIYISNELIKNNKRRLSKSMNPSDKISENGDIYKIEFKTQEVEIEFIVNRIKSLIGTEWTNNNGQKRGLTRADVAIFFRSVRYGAKPYLEALEKNKIKYAVSGVGGLFDTPEVQAIYTVLAYLGDFGRNKVKDEWLPPNIDEVYIACKDIFNISSKIYLEGALDNLKKTLKKMNRLFLQQLYANILNILGINGEIFHKETFELEMYNLGRLSQAISDYEGTKTYCTFRDINGFCWFIKHYAEGSYDSGSGDDPTYSINAVRIITLHSTKGLGFPVVFMPGCIERDPRESDPGFLNPKKFDFQRYQGNIEDERRLFYVGLTRAKKYLFITTSKIRGKKKNIHNPSCFFNEVNSKYCLCVPIQDPTSRNSAKPELSVENALFTTNYSELSDYLRCEYDYKLRYIYGFNPVLVQALGYGKQIHNILNLLHTYSQTKGRLPNDREIEKVVEQNFYLRYAAESQQRKLKNSALKSIKRYIKIWKDDLDLSVKSERPFEMVLDKALLSGTIDLLKRKEENSNVLEVIDFKTGNERKLSEELSLQVQLYTYAGREVLNLDIQKAYVHFLDDNKQQRVEIVITPNQLNFAMETIKDTIKGVTTRRFQRNPMKNKTCLECDWENICPKKK